MNIHRDARLSWDTQLMEISVAASNWMELNGFLLESRGFQNDSLLLTHMLNFGKTLHNGKNTLLNIKVN